MRVLILRPEQQMIETIKKLEDEGFDVYGCPFIKIEPLNFQVPEHDYAIITSQNAARAIAERGIRLKRAIAIGKKTAEILKKAGYEVKTPSRYDSSTLVREFSEILKGKRIVAIRSDAGGNEMRKLAEISDFKEVVAYRIIKLKEEKQKRAVRRAGEGFYDVIVFSSSMIASNFIELCGETGIKEIRAKLVAIGPPTSAVLRSYGLHPLIPDEYTFDGVIRLLRNLRSH